MVYDPLKTKKKPAIPKKKYFPMKLDEKTIKAHNDLVNNDLKLDKSKKNTNNYFKKK